jgi:hypothetical protein
MTLQVNSNGKQSTSDKNGVPSFLKTTTSPNPKASPYKNRVTDLSCKIKIGYVAGAATDSGNFMRFVMPQNPSKSPWADKGKMVLQTKYY